MSVLAWIILWLAVMITLAFQRASLSVWTIGLGVFLLACSYFSSFHFVTLGIFWIIYAAIFVTLNVRPLRRHLLSRVIFGFYRQVMPSLSQTEREALNA